MEVKLSGPFRSGASAYSFRLVSEPMAEVLKTYRLPDHMFIPAKLQHKKLKSKENYFIFLLTEDSIWRSHDWSFPNTYTYYAKKTFYPELGDKDANGYDRRHEYFFWKYVIDNPPRSPEELYIREKLETQKNNLSYLGHIYPAFIKRTDDLDIYTLGDDILVSERLQKALEEKFPNESIWRRSRLPIE